jgi:hypothetical protein
MPITNSLRETVVMTAYDVSLETFQRRSHLDPEKKLMLAVLDNAIACFQKYAFTRDRKGKVLSQEAEYWIQDKNSDWPFSFANICETLGFAPDYFRQGLAQWKSAKLESRAKAKMRFSSCTNTDYYKKGTNRGNGKRRRAANGHPMCSVPASMT